ncbi:hypothetical protein D9M70_460150 [compost metagenome]
MASANGGGDAHCNQGQGQTDTEAEHKHGTKRDLLDLEAEQQHGDGRWTGNQPTRQTEQDDLASADVAAGETAPDVVCVSPFVGVLVALQRQLQTFQLGMRVVMLVELQVVVVGVAAMAEAQAHVERVRLGNFIHGLQVAVALGKGEAAHAAILAGGLQDDIGGLPRVTTESVQPPARRYPFLENRQLDAPMPRVDAAAFVVRMVMRVMMIIALLETPHLFAAPGAPEHPQGDGDDQHRRGELEVRLGGLGVEVLPEVHATDGNQPDHGGV